MFVTTEKSHTHLSIGMRFLLLGFMLLGFMFLGSLLTVFKLAWGDNQLLSGSDKGSSQIVELS